MRITIVRKLILIIVMFVLILQCLGSVSSEQDLIIKAYKNYYHDDWDSGFMAVYITDALTSSLSIVTESRYNEASTEYPSAESSILDFTDYLVEPIIGSIESPNISEDNIIFSYRAIGNVAKKYTITLTLGPFYQDGDVDKYKVNAYYEMLNENVIFQGSSSDTSSDGFTITKSSTKNKTGDTNQGNVELTSAWTVINSNNQVSGISQNDVWFSRGAVALVLDKNSYASAPDGTYKAYCTVKVTHG